MNWKVYGHNIERFNPQTRAFYDGWRSAVKNVDEVIDLARETGAPEQDLAALRHHRDAMQSGIRHSKVADAMQTVGRPLMEGGLIAFTGSLFMGGQITGSIGGHLALIMGTCVGSFVGIGLFFAGVAMAQV